MSMPTGPNPAMTQEATSNVKMGGAHGAASMYHSHHDPLDIHWGIYAAMAVVGMVITLAGSQGWLQDLIALISR